MILFIAQKRTRTEGVSLLHVVAYHIVLAKTRRCPHLQLYFIFAFYHDFYTHVRCYASEGNL